MAVKTLGLVTIGQTPRPDLQRAFSEHAPAARILIAGALDGLSDDEIAALARPSDSYPLLVRLAAGHTAEIPMSTLAPRVERCAQQLADAGAGVIVIVCAGGFATIRCRTPVVYPGRIVPAVAACVTRTRRVGVVVPNAAQQHAAEVKWRADGFEPTVTWASPVGHDEVARVAAAFAGTSIDLVVLDCMGHDAAFRDATAAAVGLPVVAAQDAVARIVGALAG